MDWQGGIGIKVRPRHGLWSNDTAHDTIATFAVALDWVTPGQTLNRLTTPWQGPPSSEDINIRPLMQPQWLPTYLGHCPDRGILLCLLVGPRAVPFQVFTATPVRESIKHQIFLDIGGWVCWVQVSRWPDSGQAAVTPVHRTRPKINHHSIRSTEYSLRSTC
jgi:hypothetical protein